MKNALKRIIIITFLLLFAVNAVTITGFFDAQADSLFDKREGDFEYFIDPYGGAFIVGYYGTDKRVVIPSAIGDYPVVRVVETFVGNQDIEEVILPEGLLAIGHDTFNGCTGLHEITLPDSVCTLDYRCFKDSGLKSIELPKGVTYIPSECFASCKNMISVIITTEQTVYSEPDAFDDSSIRVVLFNYKFQFVNSFPDKLIPSITSSKLYYEFNRMPVLMLIALLTVLLCFFMALVYWLLLLVFKNSKGYKMFNAYCRAFDKAVAGRRSEGDLFIYDKKMLKKDIRKWMFSSIVTLFLVIILFFLIGMRLIIIWGDYSHHLGQLRHSLTLPVTIVVLIVAILITFALIYFGMKLYVRLRNYYDKKHDIYSRAGIRITRL